MMLIYDQEKLDNIADIIVKPENCKSLSYCELTKVDLSVLDMSKLSKDKLEGALGSISDIDLYPFYTILVSIGTNKNDDVYTKEDVWQAKHTAEHKPLNIEHNQSKVVGHITGSRAVDSEFSTIKEDLTVDTLPDKFHILSSAVIYRNLNSTVEGLYDESSKLINEVEDGKWCVSVETLFSNFDYLIKSDSSERIIPRTKDSAYLTKHLRIYGGNGSYNGEKVYRVLRNLIFSGKGLTKKPANPESVVLNNFGVFNNVNQKIKGDISMASETDNKDRVKELETKVDELTAKSAKAEASVETFKVTQEQKDKEITDLKLKIEDLNKTITEVNQAKASLETEKTDIATKLATATDELNKIKIDNLKISRISVLVDKGLEKAQAVEVVDKFISNSDEQFGEIVKLVNIPKKEVVVDPSVDVKGQAAANVQVIEDAKLVKTEVAASSGGATEVQKLEQTRACLSEFLIGLLIPGSNPEKVQS
jgi:hypothetical protein